MRVIGLEVHRKFAVSAILETRQLRAGERVVPGQMRSWHSRGACSRTTEWLDLEPAQLAPRRRLIAPRRRRSCRRVMRPGRVPACVTAPPDPVLIASPEAPP
jgi:hypothetical protein